jgi:ribonuclease D
MEAVARRRPRHVDDLQELPELRKWQAEVLGAGFVTALAPFATTSDSPYKAD